MNSIRLSGHGSTIHSYSLGWLTFWKFFKSPAPKPFMVFGYGQKLVWSFFRIFLRFLGSATARRKLSKCTICWIFNCAQFYWYQTYFAGNGNQTTLAKDFLLYHHYFSNKWPVSILPIFNCIFSPLTEKVYILEHWFFWQKWFVLNFGQIEYDIAKIWWNFQNHK